MSTALRTYYRGHNLVGMCDEVAAQNRYYHFDHQGTTQCLTDSASAVTDRFAADAWGVQVKRSGTSINRQWYIGDSGCYRHTDRALDYARLRWLEPGLGRWWTPDPAPFGGGSYFTYVYGWNAPSRYVDPTGAVPNVYHFLVQGSGNWLDIVHRHDNAVKIWNGLAPGQITLPAGYVRPDLPDKICICTGTPGREETVDISVIQRGKLDLVWDVTLQWIYEQHRMTRCDAELVIWSDRNLEAGYQSTLAETLCVSWRETPAPGRFKWGATFWWEEHVRVASEFARRRTGGIVAHELGHGLFALGVREREARCDHDKCGLMYGEMERGRWSHTCLSKPSSTYLRHRWGIRVPENRICERDEPGHGVRCLDVRGGVGVVRPVPPYRILHAGPCPPPDPRRRCCPDPRTRPC